jgi:hypothetical protein
MFPTPHQQKKQYGIGEVNYHTGHVVAFIRPHKRRQEIAELLQHLLASNPTEKVYVA